MSDFENMDDVDSESRSIDSGASGRKTRSSAKSSRGKQSKGTRSAATSAPKEKKAQAKRPGAATMSPDKVCFVHSCNERKKMNKRYCAKHNKDVEALVYQAKKKGQDKVLEGIIEDPIRLSMALSKFDGLHPAVRFRKSLIDRAQFKRKFTVSNVVTMRSGTEEWTCVDFEEDKVARGWDKSRIQATWQRYLYGPHERSGQGFGATIWLPIRRQRLVDTVSSVANESEQGSNKNMKERDLNDLSNFCHNTGASAHSESFLRKAMDKGSESEDNEPGSNAEESGDEPADQDADDAKTDKSNMKKKRKLVDLGTAISDTHAGQSSQVTELAKEFSKTIVACQESLALFDNYQGAKDAAVDSYRSTCRARIHAARAWLAESAGACPTEGRNGAVGDAQPATLLDKVGAAQAQPDGDQTVAVDVVPGKDDEAAAPAFGEAPSVVSSTDLGKEKPEATVVSMGHEVSKVLRELVEVEGKSRMPVNDASALRSKLELEEEVERILTFEDIEELDRTKKFLLESKVVCKQLLQGTKKAAAKLKAHIENKVRSQDRLKKITAADEEKTALADVKRRAKEAALRVQATDVQPLFKSCEDLLKVEGVRHVSEPGSAQYEVDSPWILRGSEATKAWKASGKVQMALSHFGGHYKKDEATKKDGKAQIPMKPSEGR